MYRVVALDPHPAGSDESVTHPHVRDEQLCAGDAAAAIRSALAGGRICDFFLLVRSVLDRIQPRLAFCPAGQMGRHFLLRLRLRHRQRRILLLPQLRERLLRGVHVLLPLLRRELLPRLSDRMHGVP